MIMRRGQFVTCMALALFSCIAIPLVAYANAAPSKSVPGSGGLVVPSTTDEIRIDSERLSLDFTNVASPAAVEATYQLTNVTDKTVSLDFVFLAPNGNRMTLALDGTPLETGNISNVQLPDDWLTPKKGIDPTTNEEYELTGYVMENSRTEAWSFHLDLPAEKTANLTAKYTSTLGYDKDRADHIVRHFVYVLGPAKNWAGFGTLEVMARVPTGYTLGALPSLSKVGEADGVAEYRAEYQGIPAEMLRVSTVFADTPLTSSSPLIELVVALVTALLIGGIIGMAVKKLRAGHIIMVVAGIAAFLASIVIGMQLDQLVMSIDPLKTGNADLSRPFSALLCGLVPATYIVLGPALAVVITILLGRQGHKAKGTLA